MKTRVTRLFTLLVFALSDYLLRMGIAPLVGHKAVRNQLVDAIGADRLPQVLLVTGPRGVGKQRLALWLAQTLLCTGPEPRPCGVCQACSQVLGLRHPDLHWFVPVSRPKPGDPDRQIDEVAEALEGIMAERRLAPLWGAPDGMAAHGVSSARLLQRQASLTPVEGGWRVFIIGHAERLVAQESSPEAANSLLKLLEEPPRRSLFVLTVAEAGLVLPTIRSRATPVRLGRLTGAEVREFLAVVKPAVATDAVIERANGSIGAALGAEGELTDKARASADAFLDAVRDGPAQAAERALRQVPWQARGEFTSLLDAVAERLAMRSRRALGGSGRVSTVSPAGMLAGVGRVLAARERAQGNVNPQLLLAALADELSALEAV
jgi:DNA polymerase-3 subunit delta'